MSGKDEITDRAAFDSPQGDWEALCEQICIDELTVAQWKAVAEVVALDAEKRRRYVETIHLRQALPYLFTGPPVGGAGPGSTNLPVTADDESRAEFSSNRRGGSSAHAARRVFPPWAQAACVAFLLGSAATLGLRGWFADEPVAPAIARGRQATASLPPLGETEQIGRVKALSPAASEHGLLQSMQVGQEIRRGEVVQLTDGMIQVVLQSGLELLVEGPAEFSLMDDRSVFARNGKYAAGGVGAFTLQTPLVTADCLDARAVFDIRDDEAAHVSVDAGEVAIALTPQQDVAGGQIRQLAAGEGLLCSTNPATGERTTIAAPPLAGIARTWDDVVQRLGGYERLVLGDEPTAYWPLRHVRRNRRVLDLSQHGYDGLPVGNWPLQDAESPETRDEGVYFNGESYIEPDHKPAIDPALGFTVESWVKVTGGPEFQSIFTSRWVLNSMKPDCQCFGFTLYAGETDTWEFWTGSGVQGEVWQRLVSDVPVDRSRWNHVVATFSPSELRDGAEAVAGHVVLYLNGEPIAEGDHLISLTDLEWPARIGAAEFVPRYLTSWMFQGYLSDVALYNRPLPAESVRSHFRSGQLRRDEGVSFESRHGRPSFANTAWRGKS
ncbi:MAG: LamG domain-containing protein [Planctomycetales bacterium]|nr:LamG domain-containing protein [Planctomycetales bacterium]